MDFFKELYNGDIYPAEEIAVDDRQAIPRGV